MINTRQELEKQLTILVRFHTGQSEWTQETVCLTFQTESHGLSHLGKKQFKDTNYTLYVTIGLQKQQ